jgi:GNAT superfamily N-acetyltransferase
MKAILPPNWLPKEANVTIKQVGLEGIELIAKWASAESWNPGCYESKAFYAADPGGYWMLFIDNKPLAAMAFINYSKELAWIGLFITAPEYRGRGLGKILWDAVLQANDNKLIALDAVKQQIPRYEREGFRKFTQNSHWTISSREKVIFSVVADIQDISLSSVFSRKELDRLIHYDAKMFFSIKRENILKQWVTMPEAHVVFAFNTINKTILGFGVLSKSEEGHHLAPLYADSMEIVKIIIKKLLEHAEPFSPIHIDSPDSNKNVSSLLGPMGFRVTFTTFRMYTAIPPSVELDKLYGYTTLDIG